MSTTPVVAIFVPPDFSGERIDRFLSEYASDVEADSPIQGFSRARLQKLIASEDVTLQGQVVRASTKLHGGDRIELRVPPPTSSGLEPEAMQLSVLHEDESIIAINKPAGLVVHPGAGHGHGTLVHGLLHHCSDLSGIGGVERPGIVHRLDKDTSGVIVAAKTDGAHESLARQFAERSVKKRYLAWVLGQPQPAQQTIDSLYGRHPTQRTKFSSRVGTGKRARTAYATLRGRDGLFELSVQIETGRTHQIRVHLSDANHPVAGDELYGGREYGRVKDGVLRALVSGLERQALHAHQLSFHHPRSGEIIDLEAPLPPELAQLRGALSD